MDEQKIRNTIQLLLINYFSIQPEHFDWTHPLEKLNESFKVLGNLVYLEQLLYQELEIEVPLLENISAAIHTPEDILELTRSRLA